MHVANAMIKAVMRMLCTVKFEGFGEGVGV
jgi:hypothetical protein